MREWFDLGMMIFLAMLAGFCTVLAAPLLAHDWYPMECCSVKDCAPVESATSESPAFFGMAALLPPIMVVTTKHGTAVVPYDMTHRPSPDGRMHACIVNGRLICLFMPPSM